MRRTLEPEHLEVAAPADAERNLRDLARINRWFGGHQSLIQALRSVVGPRERFSVLDVGAASGDMGDCIRRRFRHASVTSLDHCSFHLRLAHGPRVAADAFRLPFRAATFDLVLCSSLLHHFPEGRVVELIAGLHPVARRALILLDLERRRLAHRFLPWTKALFGWSELTVRDGSISAAAAFRPGEIAGLARIAVPGAARARRHSPWCRISVVIPARRRPSGA